MNDYCVVNEVLLESSATTNPASSGLASLRIMIRCSGVRQPHVTIGALARAVVPVSKAYKGPVEKVFRVKTD